jgi:RHS repeat-associated protein
VLASYTYGSSAAAHAIGNPTGISWGTNPAANKDTFTYDAEGRLKKQTRLVNGQSFAHETTAYDVLDRPVTVKLTNGTATETITIGYDHEGENTLTAGGTALIDAVGFTERGQLAFLGRVETAAAPVVPDTTLGYLGASGNFCLSSITNSGSSSLPDFTYSGYDSTGNLTGFSVSAGAKNYAYTYDELNRLKSVTGSISRGYTYDLLGNFGTMTVSGVTRTYAYAGSNLSGLMSIDNLPLAVDLTSGYDGRGNLKKYTKGGTAYELAFDAENRLASLKVGTGTPTLFEYDAAGQRVRATYPDGTSVYTPFPDYEISDPPGTGANTIRTTYRLAGQMVALRVQDGTTNTLYYPLTDHLGNVAALSDADGNLVSGSVAHYDPFGAFTPAAPTTNPVITNHGFTGHRHNNTGSNDLGLIYMNARYYLPEAGVFTSANTIVPDPMNPQSF